MEQIKTQLDQLTANELRYVMERANTRSDRAAYCAAGISKATYFKWGSERREYLNNLAGRIRAEAAVRAIMVLQAVAEEAARVKASGLQSRSEHVRQSVASDILDRTIGKATQRIEADLGVSPGVVIDWGDVSETPDDND